MPYINRMLTPPPHLKDIETGLKIKSLRFDKVNKTNAIWGYDIGPFQFLNNEKELYKQIIKSGPTSGVVKIDKYDANIRASSRWNNGTAWYCTNPFYYNAPYINPNETGRKTDGVWLTGSLDLPQYYIISFTDYPIIDRINIYSYDSYYKSYSATWSLTVTYYDDTYKIINFNKTNANFPAAVINLK